jgi:ribosomal protein S18
MSYINQAPIDNGSGWWGDTGSNPNCTIITVNGQSAWQVVMPSPNTAIDYGPVTVSPGDRVIFFANIETSAGDSGAYARLGIDMVDAAMTEYNQPSFGSCDATETGGDCTPQQVPSGTSTPILEAIDFIVAATYKGNQGSDVGQIFVPAGIQIWCQVWGPNGTNTKLTGIFINPILYILKPGDPNFNQPTSFFTTPMTTDTIGGTSGTYGPGANVVRVCAITPTASGTLSSIGVNVQTAGGNIIVAIYSTYSSGTLSGLLGQSASTATVLGWNDLSVPGNVSLTQGTTYYLAFITNSPTALQQYCSWVGSEYYSTSYSFGTLGSSLTGFTSETVTWNMRIVYGGSSTYQVILTDMLGFKDSKATHIREYSNDKLGLKDSLSKKSKIDFKDKLGLEDFLTKKSKITSSDKLGFKDSMLKRIKSNFSDILGFKDFISSIKHGTHVTYQVILSDILGFKDSLVKKPKKVSTDNLGLKDSIIKNTKKFLSDNIGFKELLVKKMLILRSDILGFKDGITTKTVPIQTVTHYVVILTDNLGIKDTLSNIYFKRMESKFTREIIRILKEKFYR